MAWKKSSRSGVEHCLEFDFIKSSRSESMNCVEAAHRDGEVLVRDSKSPDRLVLNFTPEAWTHFIKEVKNA